jgi:para-nitrobenzyl esterase
MRMILLLAGALSAFAAIQDPVQVDGGQIAGIAGSDPKVRIYKGIPYAAPPIGDLRWRAPKPVSAWQRVRKTDRFGPSCVQKIVEERKPWTYEFMTHTAVSEDCLYLNIWTAAANPADKRPVLVWIYGGGLSEGSGAAPAYDGEALARKGLVVVNMNYRVNIFGFFSHPELSSESGRNASGNYGYLDQLAALQWVQRNIAAFGGDPAQVTIAGQSAGAGSVHALTASPLAKGLFVRAIAESGSRVGRSMRKLSDGETDGVRFAKLRGAGSLRDLRAISADSLFNTTDGDQFRWGAVVDGWFLPADIDTVFAQGKQNDVPVLTGSNADEGSSVPMYGKIPAAEWEKQAKDRYGERAAEFLNLYPPEPDAQKNSARHDYLVSTYIWAVNRGKTARTPLYTYYWTHPEPGPDRDVYGAFHTSEVPYVFAALSTHRPWDANDRKIAETMSSYWVNFVKTGNPNGAGLPKWPAFDPASHTVMELGDAFAPRQIAAAPNFKFFTDYYRSR